MFKRKFSRQIISDFFIALGFFLLFLGLFSLSQGKVFQQSNVIEDKGILENKGVIQNKEILTAGLEAREREIGFQDIVLELPEIPETQETDELQDTKLISEELVLVRDGIGENALEAISENLSVNLAEDIEERTIADTKPITIIIPEGSTGRQVARILDEEGLIPFDDFIKLLLLFDIETRIKAGEYTFSSENGIVDILSEILIKRR